MEDLLIVIAIIVSLMALSKSRRIDRELKALKEKFSKLTLLTQAQELVLHSVLVGRDRTGSGWNIP